jgi:L-fuconolactonase
MTDSLSSDQAPKARGPHIAIRPDWLALHSEQAIEPELPIIDAHHHLWEFPDKSYLAADLVDDVGTQHNIRATVFIECSTHYRTSGPDAFKPVGEVEFAVSEARKAQARMPKTAFCAAMVGNANLLLGADVRPVLTELIAASSGRVRGIRNISVWHGDPSVRASAATPPRGLLLDARFREGLSQLSPLGLTFDAWLVHTQLNEFASLAAAFPETRMVLNHVGGPLAIGPYRGRRDEVFQDWRNGMLRLAQRQNVSMKLGGFGMALFGFDFQEMPRPPGSDQVAMAIRPYVETCIEAFGADRCMFESNFPVDKGICSYDILWNAFKRVAGGASASEKAALFCGTAAGFYRIER